MTQAPLHRYGEKAFADVQRLPQFDHLVLPHHLLRRGQRDRRQRPPLRIVAETLLQNPELGLRQCEHLVAKGKGLGQERAERAPAVAFRLAQGVGASVALTETQAALRELTGGANAS